MIMRGILVELFPNIYPKLYRELVVLEKTVKLIYVKPQKALYGLLRSAFMFYLKLATYKKLVS